MYRLDAQCCQDFIFYCLHENILFDIKNLFNNFILVALCFLCHQLNYTIVVKTSLTCIHYFTFFCHIATFKIMYCTQPIFASSSLYWCRTIIFIISYIDNLWQGASWSCMLGDWKLGAYKRGLPAGKGKNSASIVLAFCYFHRAEDWYRETKDD